MTENEEGISGSGFLESKFWRVFMILLAVFLIFVGPTYISYVMSDALKVDYVASITIGFVLFIIGIVIVLYLIRKKVVT